MDVKNKKMLQAEATRSQLIRVALDLFAVRGYAAASLEEMAQKAGLTKGAVYHHFRDKQALFVAVVGQLLEDDLARIQDESRRLAGPAGDTSWQRLLALTDLFLDGFLDPRQSRIVWIDAPAVLGWKRWHEVVAEPTLDRIHEITSVLASRGVVEPHLRRPLAQLFFGAVQEAGLAIAHAVDQKATRAELATALHWMLDELFRRPPRARR
jgi:AcrR family transcriptional regulator